jgi:16S rRNA (cytosine967-C5)-methyltransferase
MSPNPRQLCVRALLEWEKGTTFSDEILHSTLQRHSMSSPNRALLMELFFGVLRRLRALDFLIGEVRPQPLDVLTKNVLRVGFYQIFHMRIPSHAAVFETVGVAPPRSRGLVNACLRRSIREIDLLKVKLASQPNAVRLSTQDFLWERWEKRFGALAAAQLCEVQNLPSESFFRINRIKCPGIEASAFPISSGEGICCDFHPDVLRVSEVPREELGAGLGYMQDPSTLLAPDLLDAQPGDRVLDACAAPGGKTTYIAQKMDNRGDLIACEIFPSRAARLRENVTRLGASSVRVLETDFLTPPENGSPLLDAPFDRILLDVPCSNTGVIRRRVDVRWRLTEEDFIRMPVQQLAFIRRAVSLLKPGGVLVYSTCSMEPEENQEVVREALLVCPELQLVEERFVLPHTDGVDGAFAAKFQRV